MHSTRPPPFCRKAKIHVPLAMLLETNTKMRGEGPFSICQKAIGGLPPAAQPEGTTECVAGGHNPSA